MTTRTGLRAAGPALALAAAAATGCAYTDMIVTPSDRTVVEEGVYFVGERDGVRTLVVFELARTWRERDSGPPYVHYDYRGYVSEDGVWQRVYNDAWSEYESPPARLGTDALSVVVSNDRELDLYFDDEDAPQREIRIKSEQLAEWKSDASSRGTLRTASGAATLTFRGKKTEGWLLATEIRANENAYRGMEATILWDRRGNWWLVGVPDFLGAPERTVLYANARGAVLRTEAAEVREGAEVRDEEEQRTIDIEIPDFRFAAHLKEAGRFADSDDERKLVAVDMTGRANFRDRERRVFALQRLRNLAYP